MTFNVYSTIKSAIFTISIHSILENGFICCKAYLWIPSERVCTFFKLNGFSLLFNEIIHLEINCKIIGSMTKIFVCFSQIGNFRAIEYFSCTFILASKHTVFSKRRFEITHNSFFLTTFSFLLL